VSGVGRMNGMGGMASVDCMASDYMASLDCMASN
jgi:hypothetical protein